MKKLFSVALMLMVFSGAAVAQQQEKKAGSGIAEWLKGLQQKLALITPRKTVPVSTVVAGVRGANAKDDQVKLYWKGKKGDEVVSEAELAEFKEGIELAEKGDKTGAVREFEEFMKLYPDSPLIPDVKKTLDMVKAEGQDAALVKP